MSRWALGELSDVRKKGRTAGDEVISVKTTLYKHLPAVATSPGLKGHSPEVFEATL